MSQIAILEENGKTRIEMETQGAALLFRPIGFIDEDVNFSVVLDTISRMASAIKAVHFDASRISRMNSCGVREWILMMERLPVGLPITFVDANELFVEQANMIPGMFGRKGVRLLAFRAPYHCDQCAADYSRPLSPGDVTYKDSRPVAPQAQCEKCNGPLSFDWIEDEYFGFLNRISRT